MDDIVRKDLYRVYGARSKLEFIKRFLYHPGFKFIYFFRKANKSYHNNNLIMHKLFLKILTHYRFKYGIEIDAKTQIGEGFYIGHVGGVVVNERSIIGSNVNILSGVVIGYNPRGKYQGCPTIGNTVWIGANAVIVGNIKIGNNVVIAPNTLVNRDVPNNSIVYGNPMIIKNDINATDTYINYRT